MASALKKHGKSVPGDSTSSVTSGFMRLQRAAPTATGSPAELVNIGNGFLASREFKQARLAYTLAANACSCQAIPGYGRERTLDRNVKETRCTCKEWHRSLSDDADASLYEMAQRECQCGGFLDLPRCAKDAHHRALNGRAAAFMGLGEFDAAQKDCWLLLHMEPKRPEGYARLQQVYNRLGQASKAFIATKQAIWVIDRFGTKEDRESKLYKNLQQTLLKCPFGDPFMRLPAELKLNILQKLRTVDLCRSMRVCRKWRDLICNTQDLWRTLEVRSLRAARDIEVWQRLRQVLKHSKEGKLYSITELDLLDKWAAHFDPRDCCWLLINCHRLTRLHVATKSNEWTRPAKSPHAADIAKYAGRFTAPLQHLHLENAHVINSSYVAIILGGIRRTLESLSIIGTPPDFLRYRPFSSADFTQLTCLELVRHPTSGDDILDIDPIKLASPNLRSLALQGWTLRRKDWQTNQKLWTDLETLVLGQMRPPVQPPWMFESIPNLKVLDVAGESHFCFRFSDPNNMESAGLPVRQAPNLEFFRYGGRITDDVMLFMEPAMRSGSLKTVDLHAPLTDHRRLDQLSVREDLPTTLRPDPDHYLDRLDRWFVNKPAIATLGLTDFRWNNVGSYTTSYTGLPFVLWAKEFPNVNTVYAYPDKFDGCMDTIRALLDIPQIRTIYQDCLQGAGRDEILKLARKKKVEIKYSKYRGPGPWPAFREGAYV